MEQNIKDLITLSFCSQKQKFRNKKTGEIKTQISILEIKDYEEVK